VLNRLSRLTPLTGAVFSLLAIAAFLTAPGAPKDTASGADVIAFYEAHGSNAQTSDYLWTIALAFFLFFAGSLRTFLKRGPGTDTLGSLVLAGAAVLTAGGALYFGFDYTLAAIPNHLEPGAAQALNVLALKLFLPMAAGGFVFGIAVGLAIVRGAKLPSWLGWVALAIGIVAVSPGALIGIFLLILWTGTVSVLVWKRSGQGVAIEA
jgi:glucan phosphoethanolaminetransferase (alkaline phosphatase superfamily)